MADIPFTFPNGVRGTLSEDGKINLLGKAPTGDEPAHALPRPSDQQKPISDEEIEHPDAPLAAQTPPTETKPNPNGEPGTQPAAPALIREDPIGDTLISTAVGGPARDVAGAVLGKVVPKVAEVGGAVGRAIGKVVQPSLKHAIGGAVEAAVPAAIHSGGDPIHTAKAAGGGAVVGGLVGKAGHHAVGKLVRTLFKNEGEETAGRVIASALEDAGESAPVPEESFNAPTSPPAGAPVVPPAPFQSLSPTASQHLAVLAGKTGQQGVSALREIVLRPSVNAIREAVRVGVPPAVAVQVARLGAAKVSP